MSTETEKFADWYNEQKGCGLVDIKFFRGDLSAVTTESFCQEANTMVEAEAIVSGLYADNVQRIDQRELFEKSVAN